VDREPLEAVALELGGVRVAQEVDLRGGALRALRQRGGVVQLRTGGEPEHDDQDEQERGGGEQLHAQAGTQAGDGRHAGVIGLSAGGLNRTGSPVSCERSRRAADAPIFCAMRAARKLEEVLRSGPNPLRGEQPVRPAEQPLRILFLVSAHNSLSQRAEVALTELGHDVTVAVVESAAQMEAAVAQTAPELIVCPILKKIIPESIFTRHRCLIVHPGPRGDKGPRRSTGRSSSAPSSGG
jgi:hypothetical protein